MLEVQLLRPVHILSPALHIICSRFRYVSGNVTDKLVIDRFGHFIPLLAQLCLQFSNMCLMRGQSIEGPTPPSRNGVDDVTCFSLLSDPGLFKKGPTSPRVSNERVRNVGTLHGLLLKSIPRHSEDRLNHTTRRINRPRLCNSTDHLTVTRYIGRPVRVCGTEDHHSGLQILRQLSQPDEPRIEAFPLQALRLRQQYRRCAHSLPRETSQDPRELTAPLLGLFFVHHSPCLHQLHEQPMTAHLGLRWL